MATEKHNSWLHRLAIFAVLCTLILIGLGGLVTSREAGLAVPDWPTSFGYNMFLFPLDQWLGKFGIFEEHS
ncbi:MAG: COX15/CtaA family protein, partial [Verrucomicrobiia bacterium]